MTDSRAERGSFLAPVEETSVELRERGSRFLGVLLPAADEEDVDSRLGELRAKYPDATHHCWAWRIGWPPRERWSDAGEPSGTAGIPVLRVLAGRGLSDALVVVVRWFGGTKLGKGGLARAYGAAAKEAIEAARLVERFPIVDLELEFSYQRLGAVKRLLRPPEVEMKDGLYGERVRLVLRVAVSERREVVESLAALGIVPKAP